MSKKETTETKSKYDYKYQTKVTHSNALYGLGIIGAAVYFLQQSTDFWMGVIGIIKAIFWPALIVYKVFELLKI